MTPATIHAVAFWAAIVFVVVGAALGLAGIWISGFWKTDLGERLILTDVVLFVAAVAVATITKLLI